MFNIFPLSAPRAQGEGIFSNLRGARCPARVRGIDIGKNFAELQSCNPITEKFSRPDKYFQSGEMENVLKI